MAKGQTSFFDRLIGGGIVFLAVVIAATLTLHVWHARRAWRAAQLGTLETMAAVGAAGLQELAGRAETPEGVPSELDRAFERWSWAVLRQPDVLATALRDGKGRVRRLFPLDMTLDATLASLPTGGAFGRSCQVNVFGRPTRAWIVSVPVNEGGNAVSPNAASVIVLAGRPHVPIVRAIGVLSFALPLLGVAVTVLVVAFRQLGREWDQSCRLLLRRRDEDDDRWRTHLPVNRADEFGAIARTTDQLLGELTDARAQLDQLRRGLHMRVADRTREINRMLKDTQRKVWIDPLTQLGNRRLLDDRLEELFEAQHASGGMLSVAMFDVDHFKEHNDTHGHAAGDDLLRFLGQLLRGSLRETDVGVRYAGDEFVVLLPDVGPEDAFRLAERIVRFFAQKASTLSTRPCPTLSGGVASSPHCTTASGAELMERADAALYQAKAQGKNRVCLAPSAMQATPQQAARLDRG